MRGYGCGAISNSSPEQHPYDALEVQLARLSRLDPGRNWQAAVQAALPDLPAGVGAPRVQLPRASQARRVRAPEGQCRPAAGALDELWLGELCGIGDAKLPIAVAACWPSQGDEGIQGTGQWKCQLGVSRLPGGCHMSLALSPQI